MHLAKLAAALVAALSISASANAALLLNTGGSPANTVTNYGTPGAVSFDLDLEQLSPTTLRFQIDDATHTALGDVGSVTLDLGEIDGQNVTLTFPVSTD